MRWCRPASSSVKALGSPAAKSVSSVRLKPMRTGTSAETSGATGSKGFCGKRDSVNDRRETRDHPRYEAAKFAADGTLCGHDAIERQGLNVRDTVRLDAELSENHVADFCRVVERIHLQARAAFDDGSIKKAFRWRHSEKRGHFLTAARFSEDEDFAGIATEIGNIVTHPSQRGDDIEHADVAGGFERIAGVAEVGIAEQAEAVINCDDHDISTTGEIRAVIQRSGTGAGGECASVAPDHHGALVIVLHAWSPNVENKTILAFADSRRIRCGGHEIRAGENAGCTGNRLRSGVAVFESVAHAGPRIRLSGRHEAVFSDGWGAVGYAFEDMTPLAVVPRTLPDVVSIPIATACDCPQERHSGTCPANNLFTIAAAPPNIEPFSSVRRFIAAFTRFAIVMCFLLHGSPWFCPPFFPR